MSDSDDMPPPLEDMSEQISVMKQAKEKAGSIGGMPKTKDHDEF